MSSEAGTSNRAAKQEGEVGQRLRLLRGERQISLRELARRSGMSANALSMIERGLSSPSVSTLYRLVEALGVPITAVFPAPAQREDIVFRSAGERTRISIPTGSWEGLGGEEFVGQVQPFVLTLEAGGASGRDTIAHTGHEFVLCLRGQLEYTVERRLFNLGPGDSLLFAARLRHAWRNPGPGTTQALILLAGFEEYDSPHGFHLP